MLFNSNAPGQDANVDYAQEYRQSFKGPPENGQDFNLTGPDAERCVKFEPDGLRITLPIGWPGERPRTGLMTGFGVKGDFEITIAFEILHEPDPAKDTGDFIVAVALDKVNPKKNQATLSRSLSKQIPHFVSWIFREGRMDVHGFQHQTKAKNGRLRLVRAGDDLSFFASEGADEKFAFLRKYAFGAEDLREVSIVASTDSSQASIDVRVTDLHIRATAFPKIDRTTPQTEYAQEYFESFKGKPQNLRDFVLLGTDAKHQATFEPEGMRITVPAGHPTGHPIGLMTNFAVNGDFEVTMNYEILKEPARADAGRADTKLSLALELNTQPSNAAHISRGVGIDLGSQFSTRRLTWDTNIAHQQLKRFPTSAKAGRLRLVRAGSIVSYLMADGSSDEFTRLDVYPLGAADVKTISIIADASDFNASFDVRVTDVRIRAAAFPKTLPAPEPAVAPLIPKVVEYPLPAKKEYAQEYFQPFKGSSANSPGWELEGPDAAPCILREAAGLHIKLPAGYNGARKGTGLKTGFGVKGDFEITMTFELLADPQPGNAGQMGTSLRLAIYRDTPKPNVATLSRSVNSAAGTFVTWSSRWNEDAPKADPPRSNSFGTTAKTGRLRLVRAGSDLYFGVAEKLDGDFRFKSKHPFGPEDLRDLRIIGVTGGEKASLDVRVTDFRIRADAIPNMPAVPMSVEDEQPTPPSKKGWLTAAVLLGLTITILFAIALVAWLYLRGRRRTVNVASDNQGKGAPQVAPLIFACSHCAKKLKVKAALVGKKVRCTQCGNAVVVPTIDAA